MFCPRCGEQNPDYFVFCKRCSELLPTVKSDSGNRSVEKVDPDNIDLRKAYEEPCYDPRQKHKAIDPWDLLKDDGETTVAAPVPMTPTIPDEKPYQRRSVTSSRTEPVDTTYKPRAHRLPDEYYEDIPLIPPVKPASPARPVIRGKRTYPIGKEEQRAQEEPTPSKVVATPVEQVLAMEEETFVPAEETRARPSERPAQRPDEAKQSDAPAISPRFPADAQKVRDPRRFARPAPPVQPVERTAPTSISEQIDDDFFDEDESEFSSKKKKGPKAVKERPRKADRNVKKAKLPDPPMIDEEDEEDEQYDGGHKKKTLNIVFWVVIALLAAATLFFSYRFIAEKYGSIGNAISTLFGGSQPMETESTAIVEETDYEGNPAHRITVYGQDGTTVVFRNPDNGAELSRGVMMHGGYKLLVVDLNWIPDDVGDTTMLTVTPVAAVINEDGTETPVTIPSFNVDVPATELAVTSHQLDSAIQVEGDKLTIYGTVAANDPTVLTWNGEDISSSVDYASGIFSAEVTLTEGVNQYLLTASLAKHSDTTAVFNIEQLVRELSLSIGEYPASIEEDTAVISGTIEAGAAIAVEGAISGEVTTNADGSFTFTADLSSGYGLHQYTVTASEGSRAKTEAFTLLHTPAIDAYSRSAQEFRHRTVVRNPNDSKGNVYRLDATVQTINEIEPGHQELLVYVDDDSDEPVTLDYFSTSVLTVGTEYRFFADANGNTEETEDTPKMPRMNAWYAAKNSD